MPFTRWNVSMTVLAAVATWLVYVDGALPLDAVVVAAAVLLPGSALVHRRSVVDPWRRTLLAAVGGALVAGLVVGAAVAAGSPTPFALVPVLLAVSSAVLLAPVRPHRSARARLAAALAPEPTRESTSEPTPVPEPAHRATPLDVGFTGDLTRAGVPTVPRHVSRRRRTASAAVPAVERGRAVL